LNKLYFQLFNLQNRKMKSNITLLFVFVLLTLSQSACTQNNKNNNLKTVDKTMEYNELTPQEEAVILGKGTERPFTGIYVDNKAKGIYVCKQCDAPLYKSDDKFDSHCGWPSFDDEIKGAITRHTDADGRRTEITCSNCGGHLGHVFFGEGMTMKNTRHCVNSISMKFIPASEKVNEIAYFASGCFWGTEYHFMKAAGVIETTVGYMGGKTSNPSYREVCSGETGHAETTEVKFDSSKTSFDELVKLFFETHDFTQEGGQGPDIGDQYRSVIFYNSEEQKNTAQKYIDILTQKGFKVATELQKAPKFWSAEDYHQAYYDKKHGTPYCHIYRKIF